MPRAAEPIALMPGKPGISKKDSELSTGDRWIDGDNVIFVDGKPEKMAGFDELGISSVSDAVRGILAWSTQDLNPFIGFGTYRKLYVSDQGLGAPYDITPIDATGTLSGPFATTNGSATVAVTDTAHGRTTGDEATFSGGSAVGGITISGTYTIQTIVDQDTYTITHTSAATSSATGGGTVTYSYPLSIGSTDPVVGDGYGAGGYGLFDYGDPTEDVEGGFIFDPRVWHLDKYGDLMIVNPVNYGVYWFDPTDMPAYVRAEAITNAPTECRAVFVTFERYIFALGVDGDPLKIKWPDRNDPTAWTPSSTNTANSRRLTEGTRIISGAGLANLVSLVWTDTALYHFRYTGLSFIYDSRVIGTNCGLVSPLAKVVHQGVAYWMSHHEFLMSSGSAPVSIPNSEDIREFVFNALRRTGYEFKCNAYFNALHNYIFWFYVPSAATEPTLYVGVNLKDFSWTIGTRTRTSGTFLKGSDQRPILADDTGMIYQHEEGLDAEDLAIDTYITRAPMQIRNGAQLGEIHGLIADFKRQTGNMSIEIETYDRIREGVLDRETAVIAETDDLVDVRIGGRIAKVTLRSNVVGGDFRLGDPMLQIKATGSRP
jgi:hypothetical protein